MRALALVPVCVCVRAGKVVAFFHAQVEKAEQSDQRTEWDAAAVLDHLLVLLQRWNLVFQVYGDDHGNGERGEPRVHYLFEMTGDTERFLLDECRSMFKRFASLHHCYVV
jgi:hypothetical protein